MGCLLQREGVSVCGYQMRGNFKRESAPAMDKEVEEDLLLGRPDPAEGHGDWFPGYPYRPENKPLLVSTLVNLSQPESNPAIGVIWRSCPVA